MRTAHCPKFAGCHNVKMFVVPPSGRDTLYALALEWCSGYECRRELNVPSPSVLEILSSYTGNEADLCKVICRIGAAEFVVIGRAFFLACA